MNDHSFVVRTVDPDAKVAALLTAAAELFAERTYAGTAVPAVAERAGVGLGTVYRYFPSKQTLANAVFQDAKAAMTAAVVPAVDAGVTVAGEFRRWWDGLVGFARENPAAFRFLETQDHEEYLDEASRAVAAELDAAAAAFVRRCQRQGAMRPGPPELIVSMVFGAFVGLQKLTDARSRPLSAQDRRCAADAAWALVAVEQNHTPPPTTRSSHR